MQILEKILNSKCFMAFKIVFVLLSCCELILNAPNIDPALNESLLRVIRLSCFVLFLIEMLADILVHGLVKEETSYFRNRFHIIECLILLLNLLELTPLGMNPAFRHASKLKAFRSLKLVELRYKANWEMKILLRSLYQLLPKLLKLMMVTFFFLLFFALIFTKVYKSQGYYCDNV